MKAYLDLLRHILDNGEEHEDRTGVGTISVFGYQFRHDMTTGFPLLTTKKMPFRWIKEELNWFLSGSTDEKELRARGVDIWKEWATKEECAKFGREEGDLGPIYGKLWRDFEGVDQISQLIEDIRTIPNSRRLLVTGWHPKLQKQVSLPPCHTLWQCKIHNGISLHLYARSIDAFLGLPFNIASYALLLTYLGQWTGYKPRDLIISFGDLHIYKNHVKQVALQLTRKPYPLPTYSTKLLNYQHHPKIEAEVAV